MILHIDGGSYGSTPGTHPSLLHIVQQRLDPARDLAPARRMAPNDLEFNSVVSQSFQKSSIKEYTLNHIGVLDMI